MTRKATDILKEEHRNIERMLEVLDRATSRAAAGEKIAPKVFQDAIRFIREFADGCHHHKEEDLLFPAMESKGFSPDAGPIAVMLHEHDLGRSFVRGMGDALQRYEKGESDSTVQLRTNAENFISLLRQHIMKEDNILFVMADQHLAQGDQDQLIKEFSMAEEAGSCSVKAELLGMLDRMEKEFN